MNFTKEERMEIGRQIYIHEISRSPQKVNKIRYFN